jgi:hypothetical protein
LVNVLLLFGIWLITGQRSAALMNMLPNGQRYVALWTLLLIDLLFCILLSGQSSVVLLNFVAHCSTVCSAGFFYVFSHLSIFCDVWDGLCSLVVVLLPSNVAAHWSIFCCS